MSTKLLNNNLDVPFTPIEIQVPPADAQTYTGNDQDNTFDASVEAPGFWVLNGEGGNDTLTGGDQGNWFNGGTGVNNLFGGDGDDTFFDQDGGAQFMYGGKGEDTADYSNAGGSVDANLATGIGNTAGTVGTDIYDSIDDIHGGAFADTLTGNEHNNKLYGGGDNDLLTGGAGADHLDGGEGVDTASFATASSGVALSLATGGTVGDAAGDTYTRIENVEGSAFADTIEGDGHDNQINGGDKGDTLFGGGGSDKLYGEKGDDFLIGGSEADQLYGGAGTDTADYSRDAGGLSVISAVTLSLATGGSGGNALGDTYDSIENVIGTNAQGILGGAQFGGNDTITGNGVDNVLNGLSGTDTLDGAGGADTLIGGLGADTLTGGAGNDLFKFNSMAESQNAPGAFDTITDFKFGDKIDLSAIDANTGATAPFDQAFTLVSNFSGLAGEVRSFVDAGSGNTIVQAYDGTDILQVELTGAVTLTTSNFVF